MKITTEVIVLAVNHYDMGDNKGLSCRVVGDIENTNNKFGLSISEAKISNYSELAFLRTVADKLPARFRANMSITTGKSNNNKEVATVSLSELVFLNSVEIVDKVESKKTSA